MGFSEVDYRKEVEKELSNNMDLIIEKEVLTREYDLISTLRQIRKDANLTQSDVAKLSGLTQPMVARFETLENVKTIENFLKYVIAIGAVLKAEKSK